MQHLPTNTLLQGGKYKIERVLGQGGFGITYLAVQTMLGRIVCIKEFFLKDFCTRTASGEVVNGMAASSEFVERYRNKFIKEARIISKFDHPNIIHVVDTFTENGTAYYVMEYIEGASLDEIIRRDGAMPEDKAMGYIKQVARALDYIHQRSVNHLDVKPANIMVSRSDNRAILIDFGVSKQYDEQGEQTSSTPIGISHGYAPIEQYRAGGVSTFSPQSDIYALGATLYKLITGNTPPQPSDIINDGLPQLPNNVSAELKNLICYAMQIRKGDRPDSVDCFMAVSSQITNGAEDTIQVERLEVSYSDAIQICKEAQSLSQQGDTRAQELYRKAFGMFLAVSLEGNADAQFNLAYCYSNGLGVEIDNEKAAEWYRRSAEQGNSSSQNNLGVCYSNGRGVNQDKAKAAEWYRKAAEQGEAYAQCNLADCYKDGIGVEKDLALAVLWYKKSADQQHERAMLALADCYYYGKGIEQNKEEAINIYKSLVGKGNEKAIEAIKRIEEENKYEAWEKSWKGRIYHFLEKPLKWLPSRKVLFVCMLVWLVYFLLKDGGVIKDFFGFSTDTEFTILCSFLIVMLFSNWLKAVRGFLEYNKEKGAFFLSFFYLIAIVVICFISQSLSNVSDVSNQSIPIDKESTSISEDIGAKVGPKQNEFRTQKYSIKKEEANFKYSVQVDYPIEGNENVTLNIKEWIVESLSVKYDGSLDDPKSILEAGYQKAKKESNPEFPSESQFEIQNIYRTNNFITYEKTFYGYEGGTHGYSHKGGVTFRNNDGRRFGWDMIVKERSLKDLIIEGLKKQYFKVDTDEEFFDKIMLDVTENRFNFPFPRTAPWITSEGVVFQYQEYEIAAYVYGDPYCVIPLSVVQNYFSSSAKKLLE